MNLLKVSPLTENQEKVFKAFNSGKHLILMGCAGSGKTFLGTYLSLIALRNKNNYLKQLLFIRSAVPSRDIGFLPGDIREKTFIYEQPYREIFSELFNGENSYDYYKKQGKVEFCTTSFLRGLTLHDTVLVVDEIQNMSWEEINTIMTRVGENSRIILCGDFKQCDLKKGQTGFQKAMRIFSRIPSFEIIEFGVDDIVRSGLVKEWIIATEMDNEVDDNQGRTLENLPFMKK